MCVLGPNVFFAVCCNFLFNILLRVVISRYDIYLCITSNFAIRLVIFCIEHPSFSNKCHACWLPWRQTSHQHQQAVFTSYNFRHEILRIYLSVCFEKARFLFLLGLLQNMNHGATSLHFLCYSLSGFFLFGQATEGHLVSSGAKYYIQYMICHCCWYCDSSQCISKHGTDIGSSYFARNIPFHVVAEINVLHFICSIIKCISSNFVNDVCIIAYWNAKSLPLNNAIFYSSCWQIRYTFT